MVLPTAGDLVLWVLRLLADQREVAFWILLKIRGRDERRTHEREEFLASAGIARYVSGRIDAVHLAIDLVVLEDDGVFADRADGILRLWLPHRDRVGLTLHHRSRHGGGRRRYQCDIRFL